MEKLVSKKSFRSLCVLIIMLGFVLSPLKMIGDVKVKAESNQVLSDQTIAAADKYIKTKGSYTPIPEVDDSGTGTGTDDPVDGEIIPVDPKIDPKNPPPVDPVFSVTSAGTNNYEFPDPYYYSFVISDTDLAALKNEIGEEEAQKVVDQMSITNQAIRVMEFTTSSASNNVIKMTAINPDGDEIDPDCPPTKCMYPENVEFGENDIEFHWYTYEFSLTKKVVDFIIEVGISTGSDYLQKMYPSLWAYVIIEIVSYVLEYFLTKYSSDVIITAYYPFVIKDLELA
ncbi:hypothetical protein [Rossellomorea sp. DA94]|uniref:hypothetical protein n=1 Tax=Rossellomorea sp. DA94 TaxID=3038653 RepID=UPI00244C045C|nr:hypothetical protein [Rossellomorea sp. DA94]WGG47668.1 hypothetical protein P8596_10860 [Rossellomorea sp. DA94]